jgi:hypothetical protein
MIGLLMSICIQMILLPFRILAILLRAVSHSSGGRRSASSSRRRTVPGGIAFTHLGCDIRHRSAGAASRCKFGPHKPSSPYAAAEVQRHQREVAQREAAERERALGQQRKETEKRQKQALAELRRQDKQQQRVERRAARHGVRDRRQALVPVEAQAGGKHRGVRGRTAGQHLNLTYQAGATSPDTLNPPGSVKVRPHTLSHTVSVSPPMRIFVSAATVLAWIAVAAVRDVTNVQTGFLLLASLGTSASVLWWVIPALAKVQRRR